LFKFIGGILLVVSILEKIKTVLNKDIMAFIKVSSSRESSNDKKKVEEIYFKGAWQEEGEARWAFFKDSSDEENKFITAKLPEDLEGDLQKSIAIKTPHLQITKEKKALETSGLTGETFIEKDSTPLKTDSVVSITELGRSMVSRYMDVKSVSSIDEKIDIDSITPEDDSKTGNSLVDQREVLRDHKIKIFFVEDNKSFQLILRTLIEKTPEMVLIDWAADGKEAIHKIKNSSVLPEIILMDIAMPGMNGIAVTKELLKIHPDLKIIMLTAFGDKEHVLNALEAGATGFLRKDASLSLIKEAIKQAALGGQPIQKDISHYVKEVKISSLAKSSEYTELASQEKKISPFNKEYIADKIQQYRERL